jgi:hypothetical protein
VEADMTHRRTRQRPRAAKSALDGITLFDRPVDRLNELTPDATRCAWPGCRKPMYFIGPIDGVKAQDRYGVLCSVHAVDVAIAVVKHQTDLRRFQQFFEEQTTERAVRAAKWKSEDERYEAEKAALRQDREGFVYYLRVGERIKIGYSVDVKRRMRAYPPGSQLLAVEPGDRDQERQRHQQFAGSRTDGREWFRPTADILELTQEIVATYGEPKRFAHHFRKNQQPMRHARYV